MELNFENYTELKNKKLTRAQIAKQFDLPEWKLKKLIALLSVRIPFIWSTHGKLLSFGT